MTKSTSSSSFILPQKDDFAHKVYAKLLNVPKGKVTTYKALANAVGTAAYRAVGQVMNKNPYAPHIPCHRVIASDGSIGGFAWGDDRKKEMLEQEGIVFKENGKIAEEHILKAV